MWRETYFDKAKIATAAFVNQFEALDDPTANEATQPGVRMHLTESALDAIDHVHLVRDSRGVESFVRSGDYQAVLIYDLVSSILESQTLVSGRYADLADPTELIDKLRGAMVKAGLSVPEVTDDIELFFQQINPYLYRSILKDLGESTFKAIIYKVRDEQIAKHLNIIVKE